MSEHTPTPWRVDNDMIVTTADVDGDIVCDCPFEEESAQSWPANAAFIVKAVNNHERIVAELENIKQFSDCEMSRRVAASLLTDLIGAAKP